MTEAARWALAACVALGCTPGKAADSPVGGESRPAPVVSVPAAEPEDDAGIPLDAGGAEARADEASDAGPFGAFHSDAATPAALSPPLPVKFGAVFRDPTNSMFGAEIVLFSSRVSCADAARPDHPERVFVLGASWSAPLSSVSQVVSFKDGAMTNYRSKVEVISAPTRVGALGKIRLAKGPEYNVGAGDVDVLVCK